MIATALKTPLDILDFDFLLFCPVKKDEAGGILISRLDEFKFVFSFLKQDPKPTPFTEDTVLFEGEIAGFEWTCPKEYQEAQFDRKITIGDVLNHWNELQTLWIKPEHSSVKVLNSQEVSTYFPKERIFVKRAETEFLKESQSLNECPFNLNIFFYDSYGTQWLLNRKDISRLYMVQVVYVPEEKRLELKSDAYIMDELILYLFEDYSELEWNDLTLSQLIRLKNKVLDYTLKQSLPKFSKFSFELYRKQDMIEWINPAKFYFDEVSE